MGEDRHELTRLLHAWAAGDSGARDRVVPLVYHELRQLAGGFMKRERGDHTLQPTALVHEALLRLFQQRKIPAEGRDRLIALIAQLMRRVLVDHARRRQADKRHAGVTRVTLNEESGGVSRDQPELLDLDRALTRLEQIDPRQARIVELRVFGGFEVQEVGALLEISPATVKRDWTIAKAWLHRELHH